MKRPLTSLLTLALSPAVAALPPQVHDCRRGTEQREVRIVYPSETKVPCEVHYTRDGETEVLWRARYEVGYCEAKSESFLEKLKRDSWYCTDRALETTVRQQPAVLDPGSDTGEQVPARTPDTQ